VYLKISHILFQTGHQSIWFVFRLHSAAELSVNKMPKRSLFATSKRQNKNVLYTTVLDTDIIQLGPYIQRLCKIVPNCSFHIKCKTFWCCGRGLLQRFGLVVLGPAAEVGGASPTAAETGPGRPLPEGAAPGLGVGSISGCRSIPCLLN